MKAEGGMMKLRRGSERGTKQRRDLFDGCSGGCGLRCHARIKIIGLEWFAATLAIAIHFGCDPDDGAGELPIVLTAGVGHPRHLPEC